MITAQNLHDATPRVLQRLQDLVVLPNIGTVAGQAVASLFYEELGLDMRGPINDVDIFVPNSLNPQERGVVHRADWDRYVDKSPRNPTARTGQTFDEAGGHGYNHVKFICARSNVTILRTYKDGLRNFTLVRHTSEEGDGHGVVVSQDIVDGFDLNLVQVGINIKNETVVFSPHFLDFLNTKQLKVATCNTPTHTLIRLASKNFGGELVNVVCDYEREKSLLTTYLQLLQQHRAMLGQNSAVVEDVGQKYTQTALKFSQHLPNLMPSPQHETLFRFDCTGLTQAAQFDALSQLFASVNENFKPAIDVAFIANFPKIFAFAERNTTVYSEEWNTLQKAVAAVSQGQAIHTIHSLLYGKPLLYSRMTMPENESVLFFHQQKCAHDPLKVDAIIDQYNRFDALERLLLRRNRVRADGFDAFVLNKNVLCDQYLKEDLFYGLLDVGEEAKNRDEIDTFFNAVVKEAQNLTTAHDGEIYSDISLDEKAYNSFGNSHFPWRSPSFLAHYPAHEKIEKIQILFNLMSQPSQVKAALGLVLMAHTNGVYNPAWWENDFWFMEMAFVDFLRSKPIGNTPIGGTNEQRAFLQKMLRHVTDAQLMERNGAMLRNILNPHCYSVVRDRVAAMDPRWHGAGILRSVCSPTPHLRRSTDDPVLDDELMTKLVLDLEMARVAPSVRERRKM